jgi:hypothetical protein
VASRSRDQFKLNWVYGATGKAHLAKGHTEINCGLNSGHQAVALAYFFGCTRILLLGYDMQRSNGRVHWHADHPRSKMGNGGRFHQWQKDMATVGKDLKAAGVEVINCSRKTALDCYPRATIQEALP